MQVGRYKTRANTLNRMRRWLAAADDRRCSGLNCKYFGAREFGLQYLSHTRQVAACAYARDHVVNAVRKVCQYFLGCGVHMRVDVGRVFELLRHPRTRGLGYQFFSPGDCAVHAFFTRGQIKTRSVRQHQAAAFNAHALRHHQHQLVTLDSCHHSKAHTGVARCRLNDGGAGFKHAR